MERITEQEARDFFAQIYGGHHHIPGLKVFPFGEGFFVKHDRGDLATFDYDTLTSLVLLAHELCFRVSVMPHSVRVMKIAVFKRQREGSFSQRHPTIQQAIENFGNYDDARVVIK